MTFFDLPPDWRHRALTDLTLATNVADLYCTAGDRSRGALTLIICDEKDHFKGAIAIDLQDLLPDPPSPTPPAGSSRRNVPGDLRTANTSVASIRHDLTRDLRPIAGGRRRPPASPLAAQVAGPSASRAPSRSTRRAAALRPVIRPLQVYPGGALILTLGRRGPSVTTTSDREWAEGGVRACRSLGVRLLGFYVASRDTVFPADLTTSVADLPIAA